MSARSPGGCPGWCGEIQEVWLETGSVVRQAHPELREELGGVEREAAEGHWRIELWGLLG